MKTFISTSCILYLVALLSTSALFAQSTAIKLPTTVGASSSFAISDSNNATLMKTNADGGFYLLGNTTTGIIPVTGAGSRLMWYPTKRAFRAGRVNSTQWDDVNVGNYSIAAGFSSTASGDYSTAMGYGTTASSSGATALGYLTSAGNFGSTSLGYSCNASGYASMATGSNTAASGDYSTTTGHATTAKGNYSMAIGDSCSADGQYSIAMGRRAVASGFASIALGDHTTASSSSSVAMGYYTTASGFASVAMGDPTIASGDYSIAIGHEILADGKNSVALGNFININRCNGSFIFSDASNSEIRSTADNDNQMTMRFAGGYRLFSEPTGQTGAFLNPGQSQWSEKSDSTKKEHIVLANGEYFLNSLVKLRLGSWNYKCQDEKQYRHYGPMAQEIFHYFGKDEYGTIGNDTTLGTGDMDGIMMICLQALEKRTTELKSAISELQKANEKIALVEKNNSEMQKRMEKLEQMIASTPSIKARESTSSK